VPDGNDIAPPVSGGQPAADASADDPAPPSPPPPADDAGGKIARLDSRRARHGED
jgi:hypothetical protein